MNDLTLESIIFYEEKLKVAMMNNDVTALDELLSDKLQFVVFDGSVITKSDDLESHKAKMLRLNKLEFSERKVEFFGDQAVVTVKANVEGSFAGNPIMDHLRYLRVWSKTSNSLQVVAGTVCKLLS